MNQQNGVPMVTARIRETIGNYVQEIEVSRPLDPGDPDEQCVELAKRLRELIVQPNAGDTE